VRRQLDADGAHDGQDRLEPRIASGAERTIELHARQAGAVGNFRHALGTRYDAKRVGNVAGILGPEGFRQENGDRVG